jgi:hypothetical protein
MRSQPVRFLSLILILLLNTFALSAQSIQSSILGTVKDQGGAVIPGAKVVVTNTGTGISANYTTDASGNYQASDLLAGGYQVKVSREGFQSNLISNLTLAARQQTRIDVVLVVGAAREEVRVDASAAGVIETETPAIASSLNAASVMSLPVNTRASGSTSPLSMIQALPGVQSDNGLNFSVQGAQPFQTETSVDGISTQNTTSNSPISDAFPSSESIAEVRADGVSNGAEFGQPGEITTISKGGTNQVHGALFWYHQNRAFDAVGFGTPIDQVTGKAIRPQKIGNDFGVSAGGPVVIPHLYNGHEKTFFFGTYEGFRFPKQSTIQNLVPTKAMVNGDFSKEIPFDPSDPSTYLLGFDPSNGPFPYAYITGDNIIPSAGISSQAKPFLKLLPAPNVGNYQTVAAAEQGLGYNYTDNRDSSYHSSQFDARLDHQFSQKLRAFARYTFKNVASLSPQDLLLPSISNFDHFRILASSLTYTITPNLLDEFRFGFTNEQNGDTGLINGGPYTTAANFQDISQAYKLNGMTGLQFQNLTSIDAGGTNNTSQSHLYQYTDNLTWVKGDHTFKYGADIRSLEAITTLGAYGLKNIEVFWFGGAFTGAMLNNPSQAQFADLLAGVPSFTGYYGLVPENDAKTLNYGFYAQDQWRIRPNLTIAYGLRYEFHPPYYDAKGAIGNFDPSVSQTGALIYPNGFKNLIDPSLMQAVDACGYGPASTSYAKCTPLLSSSEAHLPNSLRRSQKDRFLPRIGLAWRPFNDDKTAVRAGFGVYQTTLMGKTFFAMTDTLQAASLNFYNNVDQNMMPLYMWPQSAPQIAAGQQYGSASFNTANSIQQKDPYSMQWNLSIDRQLPSNTGVRISYIAMKTDQLTWSQNLNDMTYSSKKRAQDRDLTERPFPNWSTVNGNLPGAQANYHSMQVEANHRSEKGLTLQSTYTLAKNLADNQGAHASSFTAEDGFSGGGATYRFDRRLDYGDVNGTRRNRWLTTGVYELPFGHGRQFAANSSHLADTIIGGWQLSGIFLWQTGPYLTAYIPSKSADPSGTGSGPLWGRDQRPDVVGKIRPDHPNRNQWVNPQAFACPSNTGYSKGSYAGNGCGVGVDSLPIGRFGNEHVGAIVGPGTVNLSGGLSKQIAITENVHLRAEGTFTNVLNHTNLNDPQLDVTNPNFGKITSGRGSDFGGNRTGQVSMRLEF